MIEIEKLYRVAVENTLLVKDYRKRLLYPKLKRLIEEFKGQNMKKPVIIVPGIRGIGKTTLLIQLFDEYKESFYFSADSVLIKSEGLYNTIEHLYRNGYKIIFIDEIHQYVRWINELKNICDNFDLTIVVSGSSTAALKKGAITLGRRAIEMPLSPLTFREFVYILDCADYSASLEEAVDKKNTIHWLAAHPDIEKHYRTYLNLGGFPSGISAKDAIFRLMKKMIYEDALAEFSLSENKVDVAERLLSFLASSKPGEFSYTSFSLMSGYAKSTVYEAARMLYELGIIRYIEEDSPKAKAKATVKLIFSHPNLRSAFADQLMREAELGALREEYFVFHISELGFPIFIPKKMRKVPDYLVKIGEKTVLFEIGGSSKGTSQFEGKKGVVMNDDALIVLGFVQKTDQK
ncbi:MAG: AAA family ATPase [Candidatus Micrarchaeota archaeon]